MTPPTPAPLPGSMTVPPWFQWETVVLVLGIVLVLAVVALALGGARPGAAEREEWQAWLAARSGRTPPDVPTPAAGRPDGGTPG